MERSSNGQDILSFLKDYFGEGKVSQVNFSKFSIQIEESLTIPLYVETSQLEPGSPEGFELRYSFDIIDLVKNPRLFGVLKKSRLDFRVVGYLPLTKIDCGNFIENINELVNSINKKLLDYNIGSNQKRGIYKKFATLLNAELKNSDIYIGTYENGLTLVTNGNLDKIIMTDGYVYDQLKVLELNQKHIIDGINEIIDNAFHAI